MWMKLRIRRLRLIGCSYLTTLPVQPARARMDCGALLLYLRTVAETKIIRLSSRQATGRVLQSPILRGILRLRLQWAEVMRVHQVPVEEQDKRSLLNGLSAGKQTKRLHL